MLQRATISRGLHTHGSAVARGAAVSTILREELRKSCNECHTEHVQQHKTVASKHDRCSPCHTPHELEATFGEWGDCHRDPTNVLATWKSVTHGECIECHQPHGPREEATTFVQCHLKPGPDLRSTAGRGGVVASTAMELEFVGAAKTVTGSKHLVRTRHATLLLDCGLWQGQRRESIEKNRTLGLDATKVDVVVLSHAHIDHSGALPLLVKNGFDGPIYATSATRDLCAAMLTDAAMIQASDAKFINKLVDRGESDMDRVEPLYDERDVIEVLSRMVAMPYGRQLHVADGVKLSFQDAGHVLGSAITVLDVEEGGRNKRLVFTGDLGRRRMPILKDPSVIEHANVLITECTYGDRLHKPIEQMDEELAAIVKRVYERGGKVIIPSFALERAQEIVYALKHLRETGRLPPIPVYVDSPLAVKITDVFKLHPECLDEDALELLRGRNSPFEFDDLHYISDKEDSKAVSAMSKPAIVISASGMCEAGRVLHHLRSGLSDAKNAVLIVGYQAPHTLGRRLVERRSEVKIFGTPTRVAAEIAVLNGFSAHADQRDLLDYCLDTRKRGDLEHVVLVHGDPVPMRVLGDLLGEKGFGRVSSPDPGQKLEIGATQRRS